MNDEPVDTMSAERRRRMAETVRLVLTRRERAPRSPRMERALKRLIWRYTQSLQDDKRSADVQE
ncbi:MAG: hypothetical protein GWN58_63590 [Anaerolineae bacterium]|nr:hypothetical protein [Anaerolineae bacterium]